MPFTEKDTEQESNYELIERERGDPMAVTVATEGAASLLTSLCLCIRQGSFCSLLSFSILNSVSVELRNSGSSRDLLSS